MEISKGAAGLVAALCVFAGAGAFHLATRSSSPVPAAAVEEAPTVSLDPTTRAVDQSEAIVTGDTEMSPTRTPAAAVPARRPTERKPSRSRAPEAQVATARPEPTGAAREAREDRTSPTPQVEQSTLAPPALEPVRPLEPEPARAIEPPVPQFEELIVSADSVVGLQVETSLTSERAHVEDEVVAHVTRDVRVGERVAIPAGARVLGEVTLVEPGGRLRNRARLGVRFTSVVLADGTRVPLETETIYREGSSPGGESSAKIGGGAIGGAIIGGILGGARGAVIGGSAGAGAGTAAVLAGGRNPATLPTGTPVTVRIVQPTTVTVEK